MEKIELVKSMHKMVDGVKVYRIRALKSFYPRHLQCKEVKKGDVLCIIEAMKLMNELESEYTGKVTEVLVKDGEAVEYGTPLLRIEGEN